MATALASLIRDLDEAVSNGSPGMRAGMLRNLTNLFADYAPLLGAAQVGAFDAVLSRAARDLDTAARSELSERLADIANAPPATLRTLAFDRAVPVAVPVLRRAAGLMEADIVLIAQRRSQSHLMAIAQRGTLGERVTDILLGRGEREVVLSVAGNAGASFSLDGYSRLVGQSIADPEIRASVRRRSDIPPSVRAPAVAALESGAGPAPTHPRTDDALFAAEVFVGSQARKGTLDEATLVGWLDSGRETEALVGLARIAGVSSRIAIDAYRAESYEPLLYLVRSVRFGWTILKQFMASKTGRSPSPEVMQGIREAFQALSVATAQRVVRFTAEKSGRVTP